MATIAYLACETTLPGANADRRRADAYEHDLMVSALQPALAERGIEFRALDWEAPIAAFEGVSLAVIGTTWNYWDKPQTFLTRLAALEASGIALHNSSAIVRWNIAKTYLKELEAKGVPTIPTLWRDALDAGDARDAMELFNSDALVVKRQVGAGADGQELIERSALEAGWRFDRPAMVQPFIPAIREEGELSFVFIDGALSHALVKRAAAGDYRIQSLYGGREETLDPCAGDIAAARSVLEAMPFAAPLYARIDMLRGASGLLLMEAELIEPYLYPEQGPALGRMLAAAIAKRLSP